MTKTLQVRVVTPEKSVFEGAADSVVIPAHDGEIGILPRHARLLASLGLGALRVAQGTTVQRWFVEGGFVQVHDDDVTVLCDRAVALEALDADAAEADARAAREAGESEAAELARRAVVMRRVQAARR